MEKKNQLLILWIIFGFVFVSAIDTVLYNLNLGAFHSLIASNIPYEVLKYVLPVFAFLSYGIATLLILKKIKTKSDFDEIYLTEFPKRTFVIAALVSIILPPVFNKVSAVISENEYGILEYTEWLSLYGSTTFSIGIAKWMILILLTVIFLRKLNKLSTT